MLLTLTTTRQPATDLGFVLHKNPERLHSFVLPFGTAHVFYPQASHEICTAALLLDIDPVGLVRGKPGEQGTLDQYVNDRPYVASSFLSVALARVLNSALGGRCPQRPDLADAEWPLEVRLPAVPSDQGASFLESLFEPLGYEVVATALPLDPTVPAWGDSQYFDLTLRATRRVADVLTHLYVLLPVLDNQKHYWVGDDEVEKLLKRGQGWLAQHPQKDAIAFRFLKRRRHLSAQALDRLLTEEDGPHEESGRPHEPAEVQLEKPLALNDIRLDTVVAGLVQSGAHSVVDLGCGEGNLVRRLMDVAQFTRIVGVDVSPRALERATERLRLPHLPSMQKDRVDLLQGALTYRDKRLTGFDAACLIEVIEHVDEPRLEALERAVFEFARPQTVVVTTPNAEYNVLFTSLAPGTFRHPDHRFEWTRAEFRGWCEDVGARRGYRLSYHSIGTEHDVHGPPTQMATFKLS